MIISKNFLTQLYQKGLVHIFSANVLNKVLSFLSTIIIVRILTKIEYGIYSYIQNILSFFLLTSGLGVTSGYLQYGSKHWKEDSRYSYFKFASLIGLIFNVIIAATICIYALFLAPKENDIPQLLCSMCALPCLNIIFELLQIYNRVERNNKLYSKLTTLNTFLYVTCINIGAAFMGVQGIILFNYIAIAISIAYGIYSFTGKKVKWQDIPQINKKEKKSFMNFSLLTMFSNAASHLTYILDVFLIGIIIKDLNIIASYKTATVIPFALTFIPLSIVVFIYPYFVEHANDQQWVKSNYKKLLLYNGYINLFITIILITFSNLIVKLCFGEEYSDTTTAFIILSAGFFISATFRIPAGNILAALGKVNINLIVTVIAGIIQILLDILLITRIGSVGAAISSFCIFTLTGILNNIFLCKTINEHVPHHNQASI